MIYFSLSKAKAALPHLRESKGKIIMVSSGAAIAGYTGWGLYGATKASINHLALTLDNEEPDVTSIAIRPGMVDTKMQVELREDFFSKLGKDGEKFTNAYKNGKLLKPEQPGHVIAKLALDAPHDLSGKFLT
jgi:NAD(P)-dependent dehydrogenase (short-subunit alcohol dehydrogenase family)